MHEQMCAELIKNKRKIAMRTMGEQNVQANMKGILAKPYLPFEQLNS